MAHKPGTTLKPLVKVPAGNTPCWPWLGRISNLGYPVKTWNGTALQLLVILFFGALFIGFCFWAWPMYRVYSQELRGKAALVEAESNRRIAVLEAQAAKDAATMLAEAEVERAKGVAGANLIIGDSLKNNEGYLRYLYIDAIRNTPNQTIYIPTEAGLPILEATRKPRQP